MKEEKKEIFSSPSFFFTKKEGLCGVGNNQEVLVWFEEDKELFETRRPLTRCQSSAVEGPTT